MGEVAKQMTEAIAASFESAHSKAFADYWKALVALEDSARLSSSANGLHLKSVPLGSRAPEPGCRHDDKRWWDQLDEGQA